MAPQFDETFRAVTAATEDLRVDELFDRDPLPFWGTGPVTLLGDAAHPLLPQTGQGAAQALVDAVTLGKALRDAARRRAGVAGVRARATVADGGAGRAGTPHGSADADAESRGVLSPRGGVAPGPGRNDREVLRQDQPPRRHRLTLIVARADRRALEVSCRRWTAVARSRRCWRCWSRGRRPGPRAAVTTVIGSGSAGFSDQQVNNPYGVVLGPDGALVFCDLDNQRIRRLDLRTRRTTTIAGNGQKGYAGDGGPATDAALNMPHEAVFDAAGAPLHRRARQPRRPQGGRDAPG